MQMNHPKPGFAEVRRLSKAAERWFTTVTCDTSRGLMLFVLVCLTRVWLVVLWRLVGFMTSRLTKQSRLVLDIERGYCPRNRAYRNGAYIWWYKVTKSHKQCRSFVRSFVRSLRAEVQPILWTPALRPCSGPLRLPRERMGICRCMRCVCATCGEDGLSRSEQLVGYFYSAPLLDVAYCLA